MSDFWIVADAAPLAAELVSGAKALGGGTITAFVGGDEAAAKNLISLGADKAYALPLPASAQWEAYASVIADKAKTEKPAVILVGSTRRGRDLAACVAAMLDVPCVSDCKKLAVSGSAVTAERMVYGGMAVKTLKATADILVAPVGARSFEPLPADPARSGAVETLSVPSHPAKVTGRKGREAQSVNLGDATLVVGVGRGFVEQSELSLAKDLAAAMGAEVACSRPIAEFFKWLPEERYLGISGQQIKPQVYLAAGISGQAQHVYGVRDSKVIVSVNKDENAPIVQLSDYCIIGDVKEVLPALTKAFAAK
jgi:electron transfer flavoprotein alpha subunit